MVMGRLLFLRDGEDPDDEESAPRRSACQGGEPRCRYRIRQGVPMKPKTSRRARSEIAAVAVRPHAGDRPPIGGLRKALLEQTRRLRKRLQQGQPEVRSRELGADDPEQGLRPRHRRPLRDVPESAAGIAHISSSRFQPAGTAASRRTVRCGSHRRRRPRSLHLSRARRRCARRRWSCRR